MPERIDSRFDILVHRSDELPGGDLAQVHELFGKTYRDANHEYLDKSFQTLNHVAIARENGTIAGFALGDSLQTNLPGLADLQTVTLGGIGCVAPEYRRQHLFGHLSQLATRASGVIEPGTRILSCGRMAHPAGFRTMSRNPTVVPQYEVPVSAWQKEIGLRVAELYDVSLDPDSFVVKGSGKPIGYPNINVDVPDTEWRVFASVNRDKGDSLLGIAWSPDAPDGW